MEDKPTITRGEWRRKAYEAARKTGRFGVGLPQMVGPEKAAQVYAKSRQKRIEKIARDRRRVALGLEPLTRLIKPVILTRQEIDFRFRMKKRGYIIFRGDPAIYYDDKTTRNEEREAAARAIGLAVNHINKRVTQ